MQILLLNHHWLSSELTALGHRVCSAGNFSPHLEVSLPSAEVTFDELLSRLPAGFSPDRIVYYDNSGVPWLSDLETVKIPKLFYSIDTHHHYGWHPRFAAMFDCVLVAQKDFLPIFHHNADVRWFPPWATVALEPQAERPIDVAFRGNLNPKLHPRRASFFSELASRISIDVAEGEYLSVYPRAKIVINETVGRDLNFRVFEALAAGALLITPDTANGLSDLFEDGVHLRTYNEQQAADAESLIRYYLANETERHTIAEYGRAELLQYHLPRNRAESLLSALIPLQTREREAGFHLSVAEGYILAYLVTESELRGQPLQLLRSAARNLVLSVASWNLEQEQASVGQSLMLADKFRQLELLSDECEMLLALHRARPAQLTLALAAADSLLAVGRPEAALEIARLFSSAPERLLSEIPALMKETRDAMFSAS